jgi:cytochrome c oxidase assembly protein subunit 15
MNDYKENLSKPNTKLLPWLLTIMALVLVTLIIGGLTRLENAGLSIVDWRPVTGIIPPLTELDWNSEFAKYKTSPEFNLINKYIDLKYFKYIYGLEYIHRVAGRLVGIMFIIPYLYMLVKRSLPNKLLLKLGIVLFLIAFQGALGWFMVKSGLSQDPHVSHYRLAAHLVTALIIYSLLFLVTMEIYFKQPNLEIAPNKYSLAALIMVILVFCQITFGAFVAGLDAGMIYNDFPNMGEGYIPSETLKIGFSFNLLQDPASVQFIHRNLAYLLTIYIIGFAFFTRKINYPAFNIGYKVLLITLAIQFILGIAVVLFVVPVYLALIHQIFAVFLLTGSLYIYFILRVRY